MEPSTKERWRYSFIGGIIIPTFYFIIVSGLAILFRDISAPLISRLAMPVFWPVHLYVYLFPHPAWGFESGSIGNGLGLITLFANLILYSLLTYAVFGLKGIMPRLR
jgi:hypothetical protein